MSNFRFWVDYSCSALALSPLKLLWRLLVSGHPFATLKALSVKAIAVRAVQGDTDAAMFMAKLATAQPGVVRDTLEALEREVQAANGQLMWMRR